MRIIGFAMASLLNMVTALIVIGMGALIGFLLAPEVLAAGQVHGT